VSWRTKSLWKQERNGMSVLSAVASLVCLMRVSLPSPIHKRLQRVSLACCASVVAFMLFQAQLAGAQTVPADRCAGEGGTAICRGPEVGEFWYSYCDSEQLCNSNFGSEAAAVEDLRVRVHNEFNLCESRVEYPPFLPMPSSLTTTNPVGSSPYPAVCSSSSPECRNFTWDVAVEERQNLTHPVNVVGTKKNASGVCANWSYQVNEITRSRVTNCPVDFQRNTDGTNSRYCWRAPASPQTRKNLGNDCDVPHTPNPVNILTGNKYLEFNLYRGTGAFPLEVTLRYNSLARPVSAAFGSGPYWHRLMSSWRMTYYRSVLEDYHPQYPGVTVYRPDGKHLLFKVVGTSYVADADIDLRLEKLVSPTTGEFTGWSLHNDGDETELYDTEGRLRSITNRQGLQHIVGYDNKGRLISVRHTNGSQITFTYLSGSWKWTGMVLPDGGTHTLTYASNGELNSIKAPDQSMRTFIYGNSTYPRAITQFTDETQGVFATYTYGSGGKVSSSALAGGVGQYTFTYSANRTTVRDPLLTTRNYDVATVLGVTKLTNLSSPCATCGASSSKQFSHDANGNASSRIDFNNNETRYTHDLTRNLETSRTEAFGTARARTIDKQWHSTYRLPTQIEEPGKRTTFGYDASGNLMARTELDTSTSESRTWSYTYNSVGQVLTADGPRTDVSDITTYAYYTCTTGYQCGQVETITNALGQVTTYNTYNAHGQPLTLTDPNGVVTTLTYDARQRLTSRTVGSEQTTFEYWPTGLLKKATLPDGSFIAYTYDAAHRLTGVNDSEGNRIAYTLDAMGNRTKEDVFDPANVLMQTRTRVFNALNRLTQEIAAAGTPAVTTTFGYDNNGNQTSINAPLARNTIQGYDELNRLTQVTDPATGLTQYGYNALDQLISVTDPRSKITSYTYNALGDLTQQVSPDTGTTAQTYDSAGNLKTKTDARNKTGTYSYDALNRVTQLSYPDQTITYAYDQNTNGKGRLTSLSDGSGSTSFGYDALGRVTSHQQTIGGVSKAIGYDYDAAGQLQSITLPSGNAVSYTYLNGKVASLTLNGSTTIVSGVLYQPFGPTMGWTWGNATLAVREYDADGNITDLDSAGLKTYSYDDAFRVTGITDTADANLSQTYSYDVLDRLTSATGASLDQSWTYDANGNRLTQGGSASSAYTVSTTNNRLNAVSGALSRTYAYDAAGNVTADGSATYTYDDAGRMVSVTKASVTTTYKLNALGQRVRKTTAGVNTYFVYDDAGHLVGEYDDGGALIQETIWLGDIPVAVLKPNGSGGVSLFYVHTDHLNTPRRISRSSDNVIVWRWDSDPFGTTAANQDPDGDSNVFAYNLRLPGQYFDSETGLHYNYFRDYDPATGRYVESDPIGLKGGINTYSYVDSNPAMSADPTGLIRWSGTAFSGAFVSTYGGGVFHFSLTSECKCGRQIEVEVSAWGAGRGVGKRATASFGQIAFNDIYACPEIDVFNGWFGILGAGLTAGTTLPGRNGPPPRFGPGTGFGPGLGVSKIMLGDALSEALPPGVVFGRDMSASALLGHSWYSSPPRVKECCGSR
jgi:RHS repeat-associated protein